MIEFTATALHSRCKHAFNKQKSIHYCTASTKLEQLKTRLSKSVGQRNLQRFTLSISEARFYNSVKCRGGMPVLVRGDILNLG